MSTDSEVREELPSLDSKLLQLLVTLGVADNVIQNFRDEQIGWQDLSSLCAADLNDLGVEDDAQQQGVLDAVAGDNKVEHARDGQGAPAGNHSSLIVMTSEQKMSECDTTQEAAAAAAQQVVQKQLLLETAAAEQQAAPQSQQIEIQSHVPSPQRHAQVCLCMVTTRTD